MEPLMIVHLRLDAIGLIPWSVFSFEALGRLKEAVDSGDLGPASIVEFEDQQLRKAA
jgi:hypothetical protein